MTGSRKACGPSTYQRWQARDVFADTDGDPVPLSSGGAPLAMRGAGEVLGPMSEAEAPPRLHLAGKIQDPWAPNRTVWACVVLLLLRCACDSPWRQSAGSECEVQRSV
eukprot:3467362-Pyramimonas_sp.AAC.1